MKEDEVTLYHFSGGALHRMIKLQEERIWGKKGRRTATEELKKKMTRASDILLNVRMPKSQKNSLPKALQLLDEGVLCFLNLSSYLSFNKFDKVTVAMKEDEVTLYHFSGGALHRMIKLQEERIWGKKGRSRRIEKKMTRALDILLNLRMPKSQKSSLPKALQLLDEGVLCFLNLSSYLSFNKST